MCERGRRSTLRRDGTEQNACVTVYTYAGGVLSVRVSRRKRFGPSLVTAVPRFLGAHEPHAHFGG